MPKCVTVPQEPVAPPPKVIAAPLLFCPPLAAGLFGYLFFTGSRA